jgi:hypothetical protein
MEIVGRSMILGCFLSVSDAYPLTHGRVYSIDSRLVEYAAAVGAHYHTLLLHSFANVR